MSFEAFADVYAKVVKGDKPMHDRMTDLVVAQGSSSILDLGSGTGVVATQIAARLPAARVLSTDISVDMVARARENAARLRLPNVSASVVSMEDLSAFGDASMDAVTMCPSSGPCKRNPYNTGISFCS